MERLLGVLHDLPRLGEIEHHPIEIGLVDSVVAVAQFDSIAGHGFVAEERRHVLLGAVSEVFAQLVADDVCTCTQHGHRQGPGADS